MKRSVQFIVTIAAILLLLQNISAQSAGDFRSAATGNWSSLSTWETFDGALWNAAVAPPIGTESITIQTGNTVTVDIALSSITGYIKTLGTGVLTVGAGSLSFSTGTFEFGQATGNIPIATWGTGSTCLITGATGSPGNNDQAFYNFTWNCASQSGNQGINLSDGRIIGGSVTVLNTGTGTQQFRLMNLSAAQTKSITINGNLVVNNSNTTGIVTTSGSGAAGSFANVTVKGNVNISSGTLNGSQNSGISPTFNVEGNVSISGGTLARGSFAVGLAFKFTKAGTQTFTKTGGTISNVVNFTVASSSTLDMGTNIVDGSTGTFTLSSGAGIKIGSTSGIALSGATGNIQVGGTRTFDTGANFEYNGSSAQVTGTGLPSTVNDLTINNSAGVFNSQPVTVDGVLYLTLGNFDNTVNSVTLGTGGSINQTGGTISDPPLPVELTSFSTNVKGKSIELAWSTATEVNNAGFEVERRVQSKAWTKIGFVEGNGSTNTSHSYIFTDKASSVDRYQYRLKQVDRDGKYTYSSIVEASTVLTASDYKLSQNYPNPFNPTTSFTFALGKSEQVTVKVYNLVGQEIATLFNGMAQQDQVYTMTFDAKDLPSGIYFYTLHSQSKNEVKKMTLLR